MLIVLVGAEKQEKIRLDENAREPDNTQVSLGGADDGGEVTLVLALDFLDSDNSGGLLVNYSTETGLALDDDVGDTHLAAESGDEDDKFDGIDIMGDDDESGLLGLDEGNDVVKAILHEQGLLGVLYRTRVRDRTTMRIEEIYLGVLLLILGSGSGGGQKTGLLVLFGFGAVLVKELEELSGGVLVQSVRELSNGGGDFETLVEDDLLALKADVFGPLDETGQIGLGADILAYKYDKTVM